jgi:hypothetical protein
MTQKMLFHFSNISSQILLHFLGYSFCAERYILAHFCQMLSPLKHQKIFAQKLLRFAAKKCWRN